MIQKLSSEYHTIERNNALKTDTLRMIYDELYSTIGIKFPKVEMCRIIPPTSFIKNEKTTDMVIITFESDCEIYINKSPNPKIEHKQIIPDRVLQKQSVYWIKFPHDCVIFTLNTLNENGGYCVLLTNTT